MTPVDIVYTWVDGSDPEWFARNRPYLEAAGIPDPAHSPRFANRDELRYSLRSVELFMPWVNRIFIVTSHQTPVWLDTDNPKVRIVHDSDIFPDQRCMPTFNSVAIEACLHRIPGLSERYIYFNDDMMLGRTFEPEDFFAPDGHPYSFVFSYDRAYNEFILKMPRCFRHLQLLHLGFWMLRHRQRKPVFVVMQHHTRMTAIRRLGRPFPYFRVRHTPLVFTKSEVGRVEELFLEYFENSRSHRFRAKDDLVFPELYATTGLWEGLAQPRYFDLGDIFYHKLGISHVEGLSRLRRGAFRFISINDDSGASEGREIDEYRAAMARLFPNPSSFEK